MLKLPTAVTYGHSLAVFLISMLFFSSCQKDKVNLDYEDTPSLEVSTRSVPSCDDLVRNGDFEMYSPVWPNPIDNCNNTIHMGGVDFWTNALGTPDHYPHLPNNNGGCLTCPTNAFAVMYSQPNTGYAEGIMTDVSISDDPDIIYTMKASVNETFGLPSFTNFYLTNGFVGAGPNPFTGNNYPDMNLVDHKLIGVYDGGAMNLCNPVTNVNQDFKVDDPFSQLVIFPQLGSSTNLDDVSITCRSSNLQGIDYVQNGEDCGFAFQPNWLNPINYTCLEWNFGDENTSSDENASHKYGSTATGTYTVTLTVEDTRGCCTVVTEEVTCSDPVGECKNYLCWQEFIGHIECVSSFRYILPNGTAGEKTIGPYGYVDVYTDVSIAIFEEIGLLGHAISITEQDPDLIDPISCYKAGYPDRGWFIDSDVIITSLGGNNAGDGNVCISAEQDSYVFFNYNASTNCP